jgi:hypothetical protein
MQVERETNVIVLKLDNGEDLFKTLERLAQDQMIKSGMVLFGIGMLRDFELGYYLGKDYQWTTFQEPAELVALHGTIATVDDKPSIHLHAGVATKDLGLKGGHLKGATVNGLAEIGIIKLTDIELTRKKNPNSGLTELLISKASRSTQAVRKMPTEGLSPGKKSMDLDLD